MAAVLWITLVSALAAHEVLPTIGDMEEVEGRLVFTLEGNFESLVAGVDLDGLQDTGAAPEAEAAAYDRLRAMEPEGFGEQFTAFWPDMAQRVIVLVDGAPVALALDAIEVPQVGNVEVVRNSRLTFSAPLPAGAGTMQIDWPARYGVLVLRQMGVEGGWDGYLAGGGLTDPVALSGGSAPGGWGVFSPFIPAGVETIVPLGLDQILFVLALFLLSTQVRPLVWQVLAFAGGHMTMLVAASLGYVSLADGQMWIVEGLIAVSIVYVAVENIFADGMPVWRPFAVFGFGLAHGLGLAAVFGAYAVPEGAVVPALLGFTIGVELGLLFCIAMAYLIVVTAIRTSADGKMNRVAAWGYMGLAVLVVPLAMIPVSAMGAEAVAAYVPVLVMVAALAGLSAASCAVERFETYRHMVAMPASIGVAVIGAYWVVERVFL